MITGLNETRRDFVAANVDERGHYENVRGYIRDLIRHDKERVERETFDRLKSELVQAYEAPESAYKFLTAADRGCGRKLGLIKWRLPSFYGIPWGSGCLTRP